MLAFELVMLQDFGFFGANGGGQGSKWGKNGQRGVNGGGGDEDPSSPTASSRSSSMRKNGNGVEVLPGELSPGLLDLHSFDTELIPEVCKLFFFQAPHVLILPVIYE